MYVLVEHGWKYVRSGRVRVDYEGSMFFLVEYGGKFVRPRRVRGNHLSSGSVHVLRNYIDLVMMHGISFSKSADAAETSTKATV